MYEKLVGKNLAHALKEIEDGTLVYLGAQSSFFDIAPAREMKQMAYLEKLSLRLEIYAKSKAESCEAKFFNALNRPPAWKGVKENEDEEKSISEYIDMMELWPKRLKSMRKTMDNAKGYADFFTRLSDRTVKDAYPRLDGTGLCVIVTGNEIGGYWFLSEKESGNKMLSPDDNAQ